MRSFIVIIIFVELLFSSIPQEVTFYQLIQSAKQHSNTLLMYDYDIKIAKEKAQETRSAYYPSVVVSLNTEYAKTFDDTRSGVDSVGDTVVSNTTGYKSSLSLELNYNLYDFGVTDKKIVIADKNIVLKRLQWCKGERELYRKILDLYHDAYKTQLELKIRKEIVTLRHKNYILKKRFYKAGKISKIDLGDDAITMVEEEHRIEQLKKRFDETVLKLSQLSFIVLDPSSIVFLPLVRDRDKDIHFISFEHTPEAIELITKISQKKDEIFSLVHSQFPTVSLYSNYYLYGYHFKRIDYAVKNLQRTNWRIGVGVRLPLFEGFSFTHQLEQLRLQLKRLQTEYQMKKRNYLYESRKLMKSVVHTGILFDYADVIKEEAIENSKLIKRLRKYKEVDAIEQINRRIVVLQHRLNQMQDIADGIYEYMALKLLYTKESECSLH